MTAGPAVRQTQTDCDSRTGSETDTDRHRQTVTAGPAVRQTQTDCDSRTGSETDTHSRTGSETDTDSSAELSDVGASEYQAEFHPKR